MQDQFNITWKPNKDNRENIISGIQLNTRSKKYLAPMKLNGNMFEEFESSNKIKMKPNIEFKLSN